MKYILFLMLLFQSVFVWSQIWKEPYDTLFFDNNLERVSVEMGIKSYTVSDFDNLGVMYQFRYLEFNSKGNLIKECQGISTEQTNDTVYYFYDDTDKLYEFEFQGKIIQYPKRNFIKDSLNRIVTIEEVINDSTSNTYFYYSKLGNLDSINFQNGNSIIYIYDEQNKLNQKLIIKNKKINSFFNYYHPNKNTLIYSDCNLIKVWNEDIIACDSTIGIYNKKGQLSLIESYFYKEDKPHLIKNRYDRKDRIARIDLDEFTKSSVIYYRNRKGLLIKIEHVNDKGKVFSYTDLKYEYIK